MLYNGYKGNNSGCLLYTAWLLPYCRRSGCCKTCGGAHLNPVVTLGS
jgi:hypothetical protein